MNDVLRAEDINPLLPHPVEVLLLVSAFVVVVVTLVLVLLFVLRRRSGGEDAPVPHGAPDDRRSTGL